MPDSGVGLGGKKRGLDEIASHLTPPRDRGPYQPPIIGTRMSLTNWTRAEIATLFDLPFTELVFRAAEVHRAHHAANEVQLSTLLSIKTGGCPENCRYFPPSSSPLTRPQPTHPSGAPRGVRTAGPAQGPRSPRLP